MAENVISHHDDVWHAINVGFQTSTTAGAGSATFYLDDVEVREWTVRQKSNITPIVDDDLNSYSNNDEIEATAWSLYAGGNTNVTLQTYPLYARSQPQSARLFDANSSNWCHFNYEFPSQPQTSLYWRGYVYPLQTDGILFLSVGNSSGYGSYFAFRNDGFFYFWNPTPVKTPYSYAANRWYKIEYFTWTTGSSTGFSVRVNDTWVVWNQPSTHTVDNFGRITYYTDLALGSNTTTFFVDDVFVSNFSDQVITGVAQNSFNERKLFETDSDTINIRGTNIGGNEYVTSDYQFNLSGSPPKHLLRQLDVDYSYNAEKVYIDYCTSGSTVYSSSNLIFATTGGNHSNTHLNDTSKYSLFAKYDGHSGPLGNHILLTYDLSPYVGAMQSGLSQIIVRGYYENYNDFSVVNTGSNVLVDANSGPDLSIHNTTLMNAIGFHSFEYTITNYQNYIDGANELAIAFVTSYVNYLEGPNPKSQGGIAVYFAEVEILAHPQINTEISAYNITDQSWVPLLSETTIGTQTFHASISDGIENFLDTSNLLNLRVTANNLTGWAFEIHIDRLSVSASTLPPTFQHNPLTDVLPNNQPGPSVTDLNFSCLVFDDYKVGMVILQENLTSSIVNHTMQNETLAKYFYYLDISSLTTEVLAYRFWANDTEGNANWTQWYYLLRDVFGPTITSWEVPTDPEYDETVHINSTITDPNGVNTVSLKWSADNWVTNNTKSMFNPTGDIWQTTSPITVHSWNTVVRWEITATDTGSNVAYGYGSYTVFDYTDPSIGVIVFPSKIEPNDPIIVNVTVSEPADASGINPSEAFIKYVLLSEGYTIERTIALSFVSGDLWQGTIPGQIENETVLFIAEIEDNAGNGATSSVQQFTVESIVALVSPLPYSMWLIFFWIAVAGLIALRYFTQERENPKGRQYLGIGIGVLGGVTAALWILQPWWIIGGLTLQEYMLLIVTNVWGVLAMIGIVGSFIVGVLALYIADRRIGQSNNVQRIIMCTV
jgi:hypothetical protein